MKPFETVLTLKKTNKQLGLKRYQYYIEEMFVEGDVQKYVITPAVFSSIGMVIAKDSYILTAQQVDDYFHTRDVTVSQLRKQSMKLDKSGI